MWQPDRRMFLSAFTSATRRNSSKDRFPCKVPTCHPARDEKYFMAYTYIYGYMFLYHIARFSHDSSKWRLMSDTIRCTETRFDWRVSAMIWLFNLSGRSVSVNISDCVCLCVVLICLSDGESKKYDLQAMIIFTIHFKLYFTVSIISIQAYFYNIF